MLKTTRPRCLHLLRPATGQEGAVWVLARAQFEMAHCHPSSVHFRRDFFFLPLPESVWGCRLMPVRSWAYIPGSIHFSSRLSSHGHALSVWPSLGRGSGWQGLNCRFLSCDSQNVRERYTQQGTKLCECRSDADYVRRT